MKQYLQFYINGLWVDPAQADTLDVIDPSNEEAVARISLGSGDDVDAAVTAARDAFDTYSQTSRDVRIALLERVLADAGADEARKLDEDSIITKEYKQGRVNVVVDAKGQVVRVYCG